MPRYLETAEQLRQEVVSFLDEFDWRADVEERNRMALQLGHLLNLAVRCNPRQPQGTVRKNIVALAMRDYCNVSMTKEEDPKTGYEFNKIHITAKD